MTLFDHDDAATADAPDPKTVRALEGYGYRCEAVRRWTRERAETTLTACRREDAITRRRADAKARTQEETAPPRGQATVIERIAAAGAIEQAAAVGPDELTLVLMGAVYCLSDDELRQAAVWFAGLFRPDAQ